MADKEATLEEYQAIEEGIEATTPDDQDELVNTLLSQGRHHNLSFFAFCTQRQRKTIEMFGTKQPDGEASRHSMSTACVKLSKKDSSWTS